MTSTQPRVPTVRPFGFPCAFLVDDRRYFENTHVLLAELEHVVAEVKSRWPKLLGETVREDETSRAHWELTRRRDLLSDSVKVFSAMSIEAFLNFYGVLRLGEAQYDSGLERRGLIPKLIGLLQVCDAIRVTDNDEIVKILGRVARRRNLLVHPKTREVPDYLPGVDRGGDKIPEVAREAADDMVRFFQEFVALVPGAAPHVPPPYENDASSRVRAGS